MDTALNYTNCKLCGADTLTFNHYLTDSLIEVDPLPVKNGSVIPHFGSNTCAVVPQARKHFPHDQLWQPHAVSCSSQRVDR